MGKKAQTRRRRIIPMVLIPEPEQGTRTVMVRQGEGTVIFEVKQGQPTVMVCGQCKAESSVGLTTDQIQGMVLRCNQCGAYNETFVR